MSVMYHNIKVNQIYFDENETRIYIFLIKITNN